MTDIGDSDPLARRITEALEARAATATVPVDAWEHIVAELTDLAIVEDDVTLIHLEDEPPASRPWSHRWRLIAAAAAAAIVVVIVLLTRPGTDEGGQDLDVIDDTEEVIETDEVVGAGGVVTIGPGAWTIAATFPNASADIDQITAAAEELLSEPGVLEVALATSEDEWRFLTGLEETVPGFVALTTGPSTNDVRGFVESMFGAVTVTPIDSPLIFGQAYYEALLARTEPHALDFDPATLGVEMPLDPKLQADRDNLPLSVCGDFCEVSAGLESDGSVVRVSYGFQDFEGPAGFQLLLTVHANNAGGSGIGELVTDQLAESSGHFAAMALLGEAVDDRRIYALGGLPSAAAVVAMELQDGSLVWQQPIRGIAVIVDRPGSAGPGQGSGLVSAGRITVRDARGVEIMYVDDDGSEPEFTDLRIGDQLLAIVGSAPPQDVETPSSTEPDASPTSTPSVLDQIEWTVLDGEGDLRIGSIAETAGGFIAVGWEPETGEQRVLVSDDLAEWRPVETLPTGPIRDLRQVGDNEVELELQPPDVSLFGPTLERWRSTDLVTWTLVEPPGLVVPDVSGLAVHAGANPVASFTVAGRTLTSWEAIAEVGWAQIAVTINGEVPDRPDPSQDIVTARPEAGGIDIQYFEDERDAWENRNPELLAHVDVTVSGTATDWAAELSDSATGTALGTISGTLPVEPSELTRFLTDGYFARTYTVESANGIEVVDPEWTDTVRPDGDQPTIAAIGDAFLAYTRVDASGRSVLGGNAGINRTWRSTDGRTWEDVGESPWPETYEIRGLVSSNDGAVLLALRDSEIPVSLLLRSQDGVDWQPATTAPPPPERYFLVTNRHGLILTGTRTGPWFSTDGAVWHEIPAPVPLAGWWVQVEGDTIIADNGADTLVGRFPQP